MYLARSPIFHYCSIPTEYADPEGFHDSSEKPKHQASSILSSGFKSHGSTRISCSHIVPELCWLCTKHQGILMPKILIQ